MNEELNLNLSHYYDLARDLRSSLRDESLELREKAAQRFMALPEFSNLEAERVLKKKISLRQAKQVVALELGFGDWSDLRLEIEKKIEKIQEQCEGAYLPKGVSKEPGEVVEGDLIVLGEFGNRTYVVDAILMDLFETVACTIGPGVVLRALEPVDFDPNELPDLPDNEEGWEEWSCLTAKALGIEGA